MTAGQRVYHYKHTSVIQLLYEDALDDVGKMFTR
jgi:hypothetical protein